MSNIFDNTLGMISLENKKLIQETESCLKYIILFGNCITKYFWSLEAETLHSRDKTISIADKKLLFGLSYMMTPERCTHNGVILVEDTEFIPVYFIKRFVPYVANRYKMHSLSTILTPSNTAINKMQNLLYAVSFLIYEIYAAEIPMLKTLPINIIYDAILGALNQLFAPTQNHYFYRILGDLNVSTAKVAIDYNRIKPILNQIGLTQKHLLHIFTESILSLAYCLFFIFCTKSVAMKDILYAQAANNIDLYSDVSKMHRVLRSIMIIRNYEKPIFHTSVFFNKLTAIMLRITALDKNKQAIIFYHKLLAKYFGLSMQAVNYDNTYAIPKLKLHNFLLDNWNGVYCNNQTVQSLGFKIPTYFLTTAGDYLGIASCRVHKVKKFIAEYTLVIVYFSHREAGIDKEGVEKFFYNLFQGSCTEQAGYNRGLGYKPTKVESVVATLEYEEDNKKTYNITITYYIDHTAFVISGKPIDLYKKVDLGIYDWNLLPLKRINGVFEKINGVNIYNGGDVEVTYEPFYNADKTVWKEIIL